MGSDAPHLSPALKESRKESRKTTRKASRLSDGGDDKVKFAEGVEVHDIGHSSSAAAATEYQEEGAEGPRSAGLAEEGEATAPGVARPAGPSSQDLPGSPGD